MKKKLIVIIVDMINVDNYNAVQEACRDKVTNIIKNVYESYNNQVADVTCVANEINAIRRDTKDDGQVTGALYTFTASYIPNEKLSMLKIDQMNEILHGLLSAVLCEAMEPMFECLSINLFDI